MTLSLNNLYDFSLYASAVLGSNYRSAKLTAILSYENAVKFSDVDSLQRQVLPNLPEGTPRDYTQFTYYEFEVRGRSIIVADYWMIPESITKTKGIDYILFLKNPSKQNLDIVTEELRLLGIEFELRVDN